MAACVVLDYDNPPLEANDSKKLSASKRDALYDKIIAEARYVGIGMASQEEIDRINILRAALLVCAGPWRLPRLLLIICSRTATFCRARWIKREQAVIGGDGVSLVHSGRFYRR